MKKKVSGKTKTSFIVFLLFSFFILNNCQYFTQLSYEEWRETSGVNNDVDVYIGGNYTSGTTSFPCYWKNGELVTLGSYSADSLVKSIFLDGPNIYCGGYYYNISSQNACYWKNGKQVKVELDSEGNFSYIYSISVAGGIVYACGYENSKACYWINGKKYSLNEPGTGDSFAYSLTVDSDSLDFYITGTYNAGSYTAACYWKNGGECITLSTPYPGNNYRANTIAVSNGKVYIGGNYQNGVIQYPCYWVNGKCIELSPNLVNPGMVYGINIYEGSIYCAGRNNNSYSSFWKDRNNIWTDVTMGYAKGVVVYNGDVYVAGYYAANQPLFWINEKGFPLDHPGTAGAANCIVVRPKR